MTSSHEMRESLLQTDDEFRRLAEEHRNLDTRIIELSRQLFQTGSYDVEKATLKKRKLQLKDRMEEILRHRRNRTFVAALEPSARG